MSPQHPPFTRVLRLRLKDKHARALRERAYWVNQVWNYCNDLSFKVLRREHRFLSGFDFAPYLKALERKTKLAVNKAAKAAAAGHGRPVEGIPVLSRVSGQPLG